MGRNRAFRLMDYKTSTPYVGIRSATLRLYLDFGINLHVGPIDSFAGFAPNGHCALDPKGDRERP